MSSKETKALFKEIREAIKTEKYEEAIKKCEEVLKLEPKSYMGHILLGAAYQNSNKQEAAKYLRKAVEYSAPQPPTVALQGLANCAPSEELPHIFEQLIKLVPEKQLDYFEKLYNVSTNSSKVATECFHTFKRLLAITDLETHKTVLLKYYGRLLIQKDITVEEEDEENYKSSLEELLKDNALDVYLPAYKRYLKLLYKQQDLAKCLEYACKLVDLYPQDIYAYEWICKIYCENYDCTEENNNCLESLQQNIEYYATKLGELNSESSLALLIQAIEKYSAEQYVAARDILYRVLVIQPNYSVAMKLLARCEMHLEAFGLAYPLWQQLNDKTNVDYAICVSYSCVDSEILNEAVDVLKALEEKEKTEDAVRALARCYLKLGDARNLNRLQMSDVSKAEFFYYDTPSEAIQFLGSTWEDLETYNALVLRAQYYYELQDYDVALTCALKATRLRPYSSVCFYHLGKIYLATNDMVRSRKCFEKCITLNPINEDAVENLSAIYQQLGEEDLNVALLLNTLKKVKTPSKFKHIHYKLGLHYLNVNNCDEAIHCFRTAIKHDVSCMIYWESLGDAYAARGSYNSAIRVYQKILEMQPDNVYAKLQMAIMKTTIRMYSEAIEDFDNLLKEHEDYLPALKGAAEAHIGLANFLNQENRYGRAKDHFQMAINMLQRCFLNPDNLNMVWLWRLTANVFVSTAQMPESLANLDVSGKLAKRESDIAFLTRKDLLNLALRFYTCALKIKQNTYLWYELALCSYYCANILCEESESHLEMATKACQMAIKEDPNRWQNWNLLGVINMHTSINNLPLAQHCFVQALTLERKSYTTWTNLGVLYLKLNEIRMANQAFQRAQQSSPVYQNAWIGQAMIAEYIHEEEEAVDLFRHCQQFDYHPESAIGYAHWVCHILSDEEKCKLPHYKHAIDSMYADVVAFDAISWYTINEENDASTSAWSFLGFLCERHRLYRLATKAYSKAAEKATGNERDLMYTNLGYSHLRLNEPNEAIMAFNKIAHASFKPMIGLALAYYKAGQHQESYSVYKSVLKSVAGIEDDKASRILVAMASMVYAFQGEADTKTILYQCILLKDSPIQALFSACALGILHHDNQLSETILTELKKRENSEKHVADIAYLTAQYYLVNNQPRKALCYLMTRVHIFPNCAQLRKVLANFLLENYGQKRQYQTATSQIALSAISLVHSSKTKKSDSLEDSQTLLVASQALEPVNRNRSLKLIQKAILLHPKNVNAWNALLAVH
ncbi:tetratricopeptide repeat protein 37 [Musca vetustissima]|uniref:tetratricopeptide repeat protein 37 n=1 Tax=Musca vetustissima TaxID=27455 RepID=UPI002AB71279|nr:tetratricopeptide repeat protein 37 [Musca vetustissima]